MNRLAYLVVEGQPHGFLCNLQQIGAESAQFTVSGLMGIPDHFSLYVEPDKIRYECEVVMKKGNAVRVRFNDREENVRFRGGMRDKASCPNR